MVESQCSFDLSLHRNANAEAGQYCVFYVSVFRLYLAWLETKWIPELGDLQAYSLNAPR